MVSKESGEGMQPKYKRILLKLSGEVLKGTSTACHDEEILADVAKRLSGFKPIEALKVPSPSMVTE